jgi:uncharacterized glyoxalase superfamily protein PhnB
MKTPPPGWPRLSIAVFYDDPRAALDWLAKAFGFETRVCVTGPDGEIVHSEMEVGEGVIMVGGTTSPGHKSPRALGGANTQSAQVFVDDVDAHYARARAAGATIANELENKDYGDRGYGAVDPEGHLWWFTERIDQAAWDASTAEYRVPKEHSS